MSYLDAIILGIVEGITEFLPVSSTGHLILASRVLNIPQTDFVKSFEIAIQFGAIIAVLVLYGHMLITHRQVFTRVAVAFVPTAIIGLLLHGFVKQYLIGSERITLWALLLGGIALIIFEYWHTERHDAHDDLAHIPYKTAALIGVFQSIALVPGVSRSGATIIGGLLLGMRRTAIVEFSFLLAIPTMAAATALDMWKSAGSFTGGEFGLLAAGFLAAAVTAFAAVRWFLQYIRTHSFVPFGVYRIVLALIFFAFFL